MDRGDGGCSLSDGAETLEACIIDAVVNRGLQWPTGTERVKDGSV